MIDRPDDPQTRDLRAELHAIETAHGKLDRHAAPPARPAYVLDDLHVQTRRASGRAGEFRRVAFYLACAAVIVAAFFGGSWLVSSLFSSFFGLCGPGAWITQRIGVPPFVLLFGIVTVLGLAESFRRHRPRRGTE